MANIDKLLEICEFLNANDVLNDLTLIKCRLEQPNKDVIIPLVGEFSSGKTSLINALTDSKKLETASKATTATIFEVRFGCERSYAEVLDGNDQVIEFDNISEIKNEGLSDTKLVRIFDTSSKVPDTTVLVDTPGLSSNDARHKLALTSYLPSADAIFLVIDVNQQITRSLLDFVETTKLTSKPIFLIITKCDTKTRADVDSVKKYIATNIDLPIEHIVCVSAKQEELQELDRLLSDIQKNKNAIVTKALEHRVYNLAQHLSEYINNLLKNASASSNLDDEMAELDSKLRKISSNIDKLIREASDVIEEKNEEVINVFHNHVFARLDSIVQSNGADCDEAVYSAINTIASMVLNNYKSEIQSVLINMARERQSKVEAVPLQVLESLDLSSVAFNEFTYNLQLASLGHEHDKVIGGITKVGLAVAAVAAIVCTGGGALAVEGVAAGGAVRAAQLVDIADTATDVASIASNVKTRKLIRKTMEYGKIATQQMDTVEQYNQQMGRHTPQKKGIIETSVGWITDKLSGKPQRRRAINDYITGTLLPEFSMQMEYIRTNLTRTIGQLLHDEATSSTERMVQALKEMKQEKENEKEAYDRRIAQLKEYLKILKS